MIDLELLINDIILYSPPQLLIVPAEPLNLAELENDVFQLETKRPRIGSGCSHSGRKIKHIKKILKRRGSEYGSDKWM